MNAKYATTTLCGALSLLFSTGGGAWGATSSTVYTSGVLVLVFIGFVALVVVVQMIPAIITMVGMLRGLLDARKGGNAEISTK